MENATIIFIIQHRVTIRSSRLGCVWD